VRLLSISIGLVAGTFAAVPIAHAQNYPWCASFHDGAGVNCGFTSYEQCMATARGTGGSCTPNNTYVPPHAVAPARHAIRKRPPKKL
jgi:Protein of unknown function (DUF3551)